MKITGILLHEDVWLTKILQATSPIINHIRSTEEGQEGGVLCISHLETGSPLLLAVFGVLSDSERDEYMAFAQEKAKRLAANSRHLSSWESRDLNAKPPQYAGAVKTRLFILSFSGFKEEQDEAAMLVAAMNVELMDGGPAAMLAQMSKNGYFRKLQNECGKDSRNVLDRYQFVDEKHP